MNKNLFKLLMFSAMSFLVQACTSSESPANTPAKPKNIILFIGDGMGPAYIKAYRMYRDDPTTEVVETTVFDKMLVGSLRTDPKGNSGKIKALAELPKELAAKKRVVRGAVTDSAAAATAYATGKKVFSRELSVGLKEEPLLTVLQQAKKNGMSTGLIATSPLTGATPAAFAAHSSSRYAYNEIANQYIDNRYQQQPYVDILLGGGKQFFVRKERNIVKEFESLGYDSIYSKSQLISSSNSKMIGLFAKDALKKMLDRDSGTPSLADMTKVALAKLSKNNNGFFLMVEGSQIDWAGHRQDIVGVMSEMRDFELAITEALAFLEKDGDTQIIITADHSTGGLSVGTEVSGEKKYAWDADVVKSFSITPEEIIKRAIVSGDLLAEITSATHLVLSEEEIESINRVKLDESLVKTTKTSTDALAVITKIINDRSFTGWTTHGHTGTDVFLYASGPASGQLVGNWDNTKIGKTIFEWLKH